ncbi:hypothetical protein [Oceanobacillus kapialis]|uniref:Uncharacterized protein n=1 Tax=Oceanobacillus kapialis TaxID=481353 RepID=A0ABW5Q436_9BACI
MNHNHNHIYDLCKKHMHAYVLAEMVDGTQVDGIITGLDDEYVYFAVPLEGHEQHQMSNQQHHQEMTGDYRQFGYGYGGFGGYPGYGYGPYYGRPRFRRLVLPLAALTALSILPWY